MAVLDDRGEAAEAGGPRFPASPAQAATQDREYREHRDRVFAMLRADFSGRLDYEEIYQDAWAELLEWEARGHEVRNKAALLRKIVRQKAIDAKRRRQAAPIDPASAVFVELADARPLPDEQAEARLDRDVLWGAIDTLDRREAAYIKLRFDCDMPVREIRKHLGVTEKRLETIATSAYKHLAAAFTASAGGESPWEERRRSVLLACELGIASRRRRRWAQQLVDRDPVARALLRDMRAALRDVAVVLPMPVVADEASRRGALDVVTGRLSDLVAAPRRATHELVIRDVPSAQLMEHAAAGGTSLGLGVAAKVALGCLAAGGTLAACFATNGLLRHDPPAVASPPTAERPRTQTFATRPTPQPARVRRVVRQRSTPKPEGVTGATASVPVSSPKSQPAASPAPAGSTEFGPGAVGSSAAPSAPAAAPADGGGEFLP